MADEVARLAYDEARNALREQDATLSNIRNRATAVLSAAAVGTSFATAVGLLNTDPKRGATLPEWASWGLLVAVVFISSGALTVLWPAQKWNFGPSPSKILNSRGATLDDVLGAATRAMLAALESNDAVLKRSFTAYRLSAVVLMAEIVFLVIVLVIAGR